MSESLSVSHLRGVTPEAQVKALDAFCAKHNVALVVFGAEWCGPCQAMKPVLDKVAEKGTPILHVDVDEAPIVCEDVQVVPTLRLYVAGKRKAENPGAMPLRSTLAWIKAQSAPEPKES